MVYLDRAPAPHRGFKLVFVPLLFFSFITQAAVVWTQLTDIRHGYFDFVLYYSAARIVNDGHGDRLYDLDWQRKYQKAFRAAESDRDLPFNHPPYELLVLLVPAWFSFPVAHLLWALMNMALLAAIWARLSPFVEAPQRALVALMLVAFFPTITALKMGQDSIITTFLLAETFVSLKRKQFARAGVWLALGLYKPQFVLPLTGILFLDRRWRSIGAFLMTAVLLGAISLAMVRANGLKELFSLWVPMVHRGNVVWPELMTNLRGLVYMTLDLFGLSRGTNVLTLALSILVYAVTVRLWRRCVDQENGCFDLAFSLALVTTALVSFHLYSYDGTLLAIPLILVLNRVLKVSKPYSALDRVFLVILIALFVPLLPNILLKAAMLAWWGLPLPILFGVIALWSVRRTASRGGESQFAPS